MDREDGQRVNVIADRIYEQRRGRGQSTITGTNQGNTLGEASTEADYPRTRAVDRDVEERATEDENEQGDTGARRHSGDE
jgi:hypothetical protein